MILLILVMIQSNLTNKFTDNKVVFKKHPGVTEEELSNIVTSKFPEPKCTQIQLMYPELYSPYKVSINKSHLEMETQYLAK